MRASGFLSTPSARRATRLVVRALASSIFLSTPSARRATPGRGRTTGRIVYFYPRPPRGGRHRRQGAAKAHIQISIHALREEGDQDHRGQRPREAISIHALREEGDVWELETVSAPFVFLSTPSARRATGTRSRQGYAEAYFYPRPPRGGRRQGIDLLLAQEKYFYPRPPRGGRPRAGTLATPS